VGEAMFKKLLWILLIGIGGQLAGMEPEPLSKVDLKIGRLVKAALSEEVYALLNPAQKLARILNAIIDINQIAWEETNVFANCPQLKERIVTFNRYVATNPNLLKATEPPYLLKKHCLFFLKYADDVYNLFMQECLVFWNRSYRIALLNLEDVCTALILEDLTIDNRRLQLLYIKTLVDDMDSITTIFGLKKYFSFDDTFSDQYDILLKPLVTERIKESIARQDLREEMIRDFYQFANQLKPYVSLSKRPLYEGLVLLYRNFLQEARRKITLQKQSVVPKKESAKQPGKGSAATPPSRIEQIREWAKRNWKPVTAGLTATITAAGYAAYRWFTGKPATK
jgi:hypothetical protein